MVHAVTPHWILAGNARGMRLFVRRGLSMQLAELRAWDAPPPPPLDSDRPGRVYDRFGPGRHAVDASDADAKAADAFLRDVLEEVADLARASGVAALDLVCAPATLGRVRSLLPDVLKSRLRDELALDLVADSGPEIAARLDAARSAGQASPG